MCLTERPWFWQRTVSQTSSCNEGAGKFNLHILSEQQSSYNLQCPAPIMFRTLPIIYAFVSVLQNLRFIIKKWFKYTSLTISWEYPCWWCSSWAVLPSSQACFGVYSPHVFSSEYERHFQFGSDQVKELATQELSIFSFEKSLWSFSRMFGIIV